MGSIGSIATGSSVRAGAEAGGSHLLHTRPPGVGSPPPPARAWALTHSGRWIGSTIRGGEMTIIDLPAGAAQPTTAEGSRPGECLVCFVLRRVEGVGCDNTLRWARAYRDAVAPADHGLERRL